jgi:tetratricopeptide (TPR) repeat protein
MERKLLRPSDEQKVDYDSEEITQLKDRAEFSNPIDWAIYQAKVFYEAFGDVDKAIEILETEHGRVPHDADVMFCLAECYSRTKDRLERAVELCTTGLSIDRLSDYGYTIRARAQLALGRPIDCYRSAMEALKLRTDNFEAGIYLGTVGFALALADHDAEEMRLSIENLELTGTLFPQSKMVARLIKENEMRLAEFLIDHPPRAGD